nr:hypothetical protein [Tanacetum cinerariifolium]
VIKQETNGYSVIWNEGDTYQCKGPWNDKCVVSITLSNCRCRRWKLTIMPCKHVVATMYNMTSLGKEVEIPDEIAKKAMKMMMKGGKMSKNGGAVSCAKCGGNGHNMRGYTCIKKSQVSGKWKNEARKERVPDKVAIKVSKAQVS